jgi:hypothetical protein
VNEADNGVMTEPASSDPPKSADAAVRVFDDPPLGGGLGVSEESGKLTVYAHPIIPSLVSGIYYIAAAALYVDIGMSVLLAVVMTRLGRADPLFWYFFAGQFVTIVGGCVWVRRWIRGIAERTYEISLDNSRVVVFCKAGDRVTREERSISEVAGVEPETIVSSGEGSDKRPDIVRLLLKMKSGPPVEILYGRPREETEWLQTRVRRFLDEQRKSADSLKITLTAAKSSDL